MQNERVISVAACNELQAIVLVLTARCADTAAARDAVMRERDAAQLRVKSLEDELARLKAAQSSAGGEQ